MLDETSTAAASEQQGSLRAATGKYMTFKLADEEYGLEILRVRELIRLMEITEVPRTADHVRGVINLRGKVFPVVDLRKLFGMDAVEATDQTVIIVVQHGGAEMSKTTGILVDEVLEVLSIDESDLDPPPDFGSGSDADMLLGIGKAESRVIFLLNIERVLS